MTNVQADLRSYYEEEARQGWRGPLKGRRVELREEYIALLRSEARAAVVDFGAGPGFDGAAFKQVGIAYTGVDLAHGNGVIASQSNIAVVQGSLTHPPFKPAGFAAGWSMSTLMHLPVAEVPGALAAMAESLTPGAPLMIGLWGGSLGEHVDETRQPGQRRLFSLRSFADNQVLMNGGGDVEREEVWPVGPEGWEYHVFMLRAPR